MALKTRAQLKAIWITGATMTETLFDDVWDSFYNISEDGSLSNVENVALSTWAGTTNITTLGTITTGNWNATEISIAKGGTGQTTAQAAINALTQVGGATNEYVLTKDTATGDAVWKIIPAVSGDIVVDSIQLTGGIGNQGLMTWHDAEATVELVNNGSTTLIGQEFHYHVRNNTGVLLAKGTVVQVTGTLGASGKITVGPYLADGTTPSKYLIGILQEDIANSSDGKVHGKGKIENLNTVGGLSAGGLETWNDGDVLYCDPVNTGLLTKVKPEAPNQKIPIAFVIYAHATNGVLQVRTQPNQSFEDNEQVQISSPQNGEVLSYNSSNQRWENATPGAILYQSIAIDTTLTAGTKRVFVTASSPGDSIQVTLPATPTINEVYEIIDADGIAVTDNIVINGNGKLINGNATATLNKAYSAFKVVYNGVGYNVI